MANNKRKIPFFNKEKFIYKLLFIISIFVFAFLIIRIISSSGEVDNFKSVSKKPYKTVSDKKDALNIAYNNIDKASSDNSSLSPTNLNIAKIYKVVNDPEAIGLTANNKPVPVTIDSIIEAPEDREEVVIEEPETSAFQIYEKLQNRFSMLKQTFYNMCESDPRLLTRIGNDGYRLIGKYNPTNPTHIINKRHTWLITSFQNVNIYYMDGDGKLLDDENNIKDIMSMASVYTYYKDPYDVNTFLKYCYDVFDNSYYYVASVSDVYYCSGCMHYDDPTIATGSTTHIDTTYEKIKTETHPQKVLPKDIPYKAGTLKRMNDDDYTLTEGDYKSYLKNIYNKSETSELNYCPGHVDLNFYVTFLTIDSKNSLFSVDNKYGNRGFNFKGDWHGWDPYKKYYARLLSYKKKEKEYGLGISKLQFIEPLTQEEINYYLSRLDKDLSPNRRAVIETALKSVGKIPYYYGGKTHNFGFKANAFGSKIAADYKGRCLKGLDCSGWVNWVYGTTFNKYIIKSEGTNKLAGEGTKILRKELLPGDIIVRPGIDSHVMMFLEWAPGGKMTVIHENGAVNNVSIGTFDAYYPYYRRILNS